MTVPVDLPVTISIAGRFANQTLAVLDEQVAAFEARNPDIKIEVVRAPRDPFQRRKWVGSLLGERDTSVDIYVLDAAWPAELAADGGLIPLDGRLAAQGIRPEVFLASTLQANSVDGHLVAFPWTADSGLLFYRRDLLGRYGFAPPTSWEELRDVSLAIKAGETMRYGFVWPGAADEDLTCSTLEHLWSRSPEKLDAPENGLANPIQMREALGQMKGLVDSGASPKDIAAYDQWAARTAFRNGEAIFLRDWYSAWDNLNSSESPVAGQTGMAPLPAGCLGGQSLGLSAYSLHPDEATRFMTFLSGYDQQAKLATAAGQLPALEAVYDDETVLTAVPILKQVRTALSTTQPRPSVAGYARISAVVYTEVSRMLAGQLDIETTAENIEHIVELLVH